MIDDREVPARTTRAAVFAALAVLSSLALRAKTDGALPAPSVIVGAFVLVALLARPFTARERRLPAVLAGLVASEFVLHVAFLFASTGELAHSGGAGLVCSPASGDGSGCLPTERGGFLLLVVQLLAALAFAWWARGADSMSWRLVRESLATFLAFLRRVAIVLFGALIFSVPSSEVAVAPARTPAPLRQVTLARAHRRRGPPSPSRLAPLFASARLALSV